MGKTGERAGGMGHLALSTLLGGVVSVMLSLLVLLLCAAMISAGLLGQSEPIQPVLAACGIGGAAGGLFTCFQWPSRRFLAGLSGALSGFLMLLLIRLSVAGVSALGSQTLLVLFGSLGGGGLSGLLTAGKKSRKKKRSY